MTANQILIIVIGLFFFITGLSYMFQTKNEEGDIKRKKTVSYVLISLGVIISLLPFYSNLLPLGSETRSSSKGESRLLGQDIYQRAIPRGSGTLAQASNLYIRAISNFNEEINGWDSAEVTLDVLSSSIEVYETAEAYTARGRLKIQLGFFEQAFSDYNRALELNPELGNTYFNRGSAYYIIGDMQAACADWKKAKELNFPQADGVLGMCD